MAGSIRGRTIVGKRPPAWLISERKRLDRLNIRIATLIQERTLIATRVAQRKNFEGMVVPDPHRELQMIDDVLRRGGPGLPGEALERVFLTLFNETRRAIYQRIKELPVDVAVERESPTNRRPPSGKGTRR